MNNNEKKIHSLKKLALALNAEIKCENEYISLKKEENIAIICLSNIDNDIFKNPILFLDNNMTFGKHISFEILDFVLSSNEKVKELFSCWLFNKNFENYMTVLTENCTKKNRNVKIQKDIEEKKEKKVVEKNVDNVNEAISSAYGKDFVFNPETKAYHSTDNTITCISLISKNYEKEYFNYWYSYRPNQKIILEKYDKGFILLLFKDSNDILALPVAFLNGLLYQLTSSGSGEKRYWHLRIKKTKDRYVLRLPNHGLEDITKFLLKKDQINQVDDDELIIKIKSMNSKVKNKR